MAKLESNLCFNNRAKLILISLCLLSTVFSQDKYLYKTVVDSFLIDTINHYKLKNKTVLLESVKVFIEEKEINKSQYTLAPDNAIILNIQATKGDKLLVLYKTVFLNFQQIYKTQHQHFDKPLNKKLDSGSNLGNNNLFGSSINKNGYIGRGFNISTGRDMTLNSNFRLELEGTIINDIKLVASLTDEKLPFQPEGNTENLDEIDKVFIELKNNQAGILFGDFNLKLEKNDFIRINKKVKGLKTEYTSENYFVQAVYASLHGKFNSNFFNGSEGVLGPYRLTGKNNEREIFIIAGSEKVYLDGRLMKRGEGNDYTIDYSTSEIIFSPVIRITSYSRINVDFEYSDLSYRRNFYSVNTGVNLLGDKLKLTFDYISESDNKDKPYEEISPSAIKKLNSIGSDLSQAFISGEIFVSPDSSGNSSGKYIKIDTSYINTPYTLFRYSPGSPDANYNVSFSYMGEGKGDYKKEGFGNYKFVGVGLGEYAPVKKLPVPQSIQNLNLGIKYGLSDILELNSNIAGSFFNKNLFSTNSSDNGFAGTVSLNIHPFLLVKDNPDWGKLNFAFSLRALSNNYENVDRFESVEFKRDYNIFEINSDKKETLSEISVWYNNTEKIKMNLLFGNLNKTDGISSVRTKNNIIINVNNFKISNIFENTNVRTGNINSVFLRDNFSGEIKIISFGVGSNLNYESKKNFLTDTLLQNTSYKFSEINPYMFFQDKSINIKYSFLHRSDFRTYNNQLDKYSDMLTHTFSSNLTRWREFNTNFDVSYNKIDYRISETSDNYILYRGKINSNLFNNSVVTAFFYESGKQKTSKFQKLFVKVPVGQGNYRYRGDLNKNNVADEDEFEFTIFDGDFIITSLPSDELIPVVNTNFNFRMKTDFNNLIKGEGFTAVLVKSLSNEMMFRVEESSKINDTKKISLLNLKYFLNDTTTIRGYQIFQNDLFVNRQSGVFNLRLKFFQKKSLINFNSGLEGSFLKEQSIKLLLSLSALSVINLEYLNKIDNQFNKFTTVKNWKINSDEINVEINNRLTDDLDLRLKLSTGKLTDEFPQTPTIINSNKQSVELYYSIVKKGKIRFELEREELITSEKGNYIPFEVLKGNIIGKNYYLKVNFDYRISDLINSSLFYLGRINGNSPVGHSMQAEIKASF